MTNFRELARESSDALARVQDLATQWEQQGLGYLSIPEAAARLREVLDEGPPDPRTPELESFASGAACETCGGAGDIFTNPTWNNDPQFEEDHPCPSCNGAGVDPGPQWPTR